MPEIMIGEWFDEYRPISGEGLEDTQILGRVAAQFVWTEVEYGMPPPHSMTRLEFAAVLARLRKLQDASEAERMECSEILTDLDELEPFTTDEIGALAEKLNATDQKDR
jgi:hypothetical protein